MCSLIPHSQKAPLTFEKAGRAGSCGSAVAGFESPTGRHRIRFSWRLPVRRRNLPMMIGSKPHGARPLANQIRGVGLFGVCGSSAAPHEGDAIADLPCFFEIESAGRSFHLALQIFDGFVHIGPMHGWDFQHRMSYADERGSWIRRRNMPTPCATDLRFARSSGDQTRARIESALPPYSRSAIPRQPAATGQPASGRGCRPYPRMLRS